MNRIVVVIQYKKLEFLPPVMALLQTLKAIGRKVIYIGVESTCGKDFLERNRIDCRFLPAFNHALYSSHGFISKITNRIRRALAFYSHRRWLQRTLMGIEHEQGELLIWHSEIASAAWLGDWGLRFRHRFLTIYELADFRGASWLGFDLRDCLKQVHLVVPEYNRACILKEHFLLGELPFVIPNKPFEHPRRGRLPLPTRKIEEIFSKIGDRPVFLYQGVWNEDRSEVAKVLEVIARYRPNYCIVSMPSCPAVEKLSTHYPNVFGLPYVAPPGHLAVTSRATVGIAIYNPAGRGLLQRLGAVYCAPNKIYEYAGFGIPTLGNDLPGLHFTIEQAGAGRCCRLDAQSILDAADDLVINNERYKLNAERFFDETDLMKILTDILERTENNDG